MQTVPLIKDLHKQDSPRIIDLILPIQQIEFNVPITLEGQPDLLDIERYYYEDGGRFWGAVVNEQLVGTIALIVADGNIGVIRKMFVAKDFRGKDIGTATILLQALIDHCRETGIHDLYLGTVDLLKAALRFYERNGFTQIAADALPAAFPRMKPDNMFYHLHLD